jgi:RNA polymerase sigma-70 factor (ECF subfamily)
MVQTTAKLPVRRSYQEATDERLLLWYRDEGDLKAFETLVNRYEKPLFNYLLRFLHSVSLAEEVFQATFMRVHEKCQLFTPGRQARPWIYSIATNLAIDALRKEGRYHATSLDMEQADAEAHAGKLSDLLPTDLPSPLEQIEAREEAAWTRRAVDALPEHLRVVVLLAYFQGLKFQEVAEILQMPLGTVKSRLHKALVTLHSAWRRNHRGQ